MSKHHLGYRKWLLYLWPREPDLYIGGEKNPYMKRWYLIRTPWFGVNLHQFCRDDDDRALHDHPWRSVSLILRGGYFEVTPGPRWYEGLRGSLKAAWYGAGNLVGVREAEAAHRIVLAKNPITDEPVPCWTLFFVGKKTRSWGFHCAQGWRNWKEYVNLDDPGLIGPGCE